MAKGTTATIRRKLVHVPARIASSARRLSLHLPKGWPWEDAWTTLFTGLCAPPPSRDDLTTCPAGLEEKPVEHHRQ